MRSLLPVLLLWLVSVSEAQGPRRRDGRAPRPPSDASTHEVVYLDQAWAPRDRAAWYWTSQGSAMVSADLFLALEQAEGTELFGSPENSERYGLIVERTDPTFNPDGLPIGLARLSVPDGPFAGEWVGPTCAMCHTAQWEYQGRAVRIDGGAQNVLDYDRWLSALDDAFQATAADAAKLARLVSRVRAGGADEAKIRERFARDAAALHQYVTRVVRPPTPTGPRMDALSGIHNQLTGNRTGLLQNLGAPAAPVKPPFVWNAPQSDWVQWSGIANDPFVRNFTEVVGVFALYDLTSTEAGFRSTADVDGLIELEELVRRLAPPAWPADVFGPLDPGKVAAGERLYGELCVECHTSWPYRWSEPRLEGQRFIANAMVPVEVIGTDPTQHDLFLFDPDPEASTGPFAPLFDGRSKVPPSELRGGLVAQLTRAALAADPPSASRTRSLHAYLPPGEHAVAAVRSYKAGPRDGVWATGPYLHNGSVPNLYELLLPDERRSTTFSLGRTFDPVKVGPETSPGAGKFAFDTRLPGNSNAGHSFEKGFGPGIIGRELRESERWALIEYLKSIPDVAGRVTPFGGPPDAVPAASDPDWYNSHHPW